MIHHVAPSILSFNHADFLTPVRQLAAAGLKVLHLDVMDGQFVPPITFGDGVAKGLSQVPGLLLEAHLMTQTPERHFEAFVKAGCQRIIFHVEATSHAHRLAQMLRGMGVQSGIALNPGTPLEAILPVLEEVDLVLAMTVNPGWGGQAIIPAVLDKVAALRTRAPHLEIEVDGGIDDRTILSARDAGANLFVAGSFLTKFADPGEGFRVLSDKLNSPTMV